jgi:hypothetical protein
MNRAANRASMQGGIRMSRAKLLSTIRSAMMRMMTGAAAAAGIAAMLAMGACSPATPPPGATEAQEQRMAANFDLSKCEILEAGLYRCPGSDKPICDPDFARNEVECVKVTRNGVLLEVPAE